MTSRRWSDFLALYEGDGSHPSAEGAYLAACVLVSTITGVGPTAFPDGAAVDPTRAAALRDIASRTMLDPEWTITEM